MKDLNITRVTLTFVVLLLVNLSSRRRPDRVTLSLARILVFLLVARISARNLFIPLVRKISCSCLLLLTS